MCNGARFDRHANLVARMGDALGVDLEARLQEGRVLPEEVDLMVCDCMGCPKPGACDAALAAGVPKASGAPEYCRNGEAFARLAGE